MGLENFVYNANPGRVIFGSGTISRLCEEADRLRVKRVLVLSTPDQKGHAEDISAHLGERVVGMFSNATMHTPTDVTADAMKLVDTLQADAVVAIGGGSTTGLGKAIAYRTDLPQIVVPTTYAGSEATPILGETEGGRKITKSDPRILPEVIIYDVDLTLSLPIPISVTSGFNAIAHAVEALYAKEVNPIISMMAIEGIAAIARALPQIKRNPGDKVARSDALYGAWLCGICLGSVGMALHHKLCHTLGGMFNLPHAALHTAVLPHAVAYNASAAPAAMAAVGRVLGVADPAKGLFELSQGLGATMALKVLGMPEDGIEPSVEQVIASQYWNLRSLEKNALHELIRHAYYGIPPGSD